MWEPDVWRALKKDEYTNKAGEINNAIQAKYDEVNIKNRKNEIQPRGPDPSQDLLNELAKTKQFQITDKFRQDFNDEIDQNKFDFEDQKRAEKGALERSITNKQKIDP